MPRSRPIAALVLLVLAGVLAFARPLQSQVLRNSFWQPNGPVTALACANNVLYLGGSFSRIGPPTGGLARLDFNSGQLAGPQPRVDGRVNVIAGDGAGGLYLGGRFSTVQGVARANLAHVDATGNVTAWNPGTDGEVFALAFDASNPTAVYVGGQFSRLGGQLRLCLGAADPTSGAVRTWNPSVTGSGSPAVYALAVRGGLVYLGGSFADVSALPRNNVAVVDTSGALTVNDPDVNGVVRAFAFYTLNHTPFTNDWFIGGSFTRINGQTAMGLGAVDAANGASVAYSASLNGTVNSMSLSVSNLGAPTLWVGGSFTQANGVAHQNLAAFDAAGGLRAWSPTADAAVRSLVYAGGTLVAGGAFHVAGGQLRPCLASFTSAGAVTGWSPTPDSTVNVVAVSGGAVLAGGDFNTLGGVPRRNLAALDATSGLPTSWDPGANGLVNALGVDNGNLYAGGAFDSVAGQARAHVAQFAIATNSLTAWNPVVNGYVRALAVHKGSVYVCGNFSMIGPTPRPGVGAIDAQGAATMWNPTPVNGSVYAITANDHTIFIGGSFAAAGGAQRSNVAALDDAGGRATLWNAGPNFPANGDVVYALAASGTGVYIGGHFSQMGGASRANLAVVDTAFGMTFLGSDLSVDPQSSVYALEASGNTVYVGGNFRGIDHSVRGALAGIDGGSATVSSWNPNLYYYVGSIGVGGSSVFAGGLIAGTYTTFGSTMRLAAVSTAVTGVDPSTAGVATGPLRIEPNPARAAMAFRFELPRAGRVEAAVFSPAGRCVRVLDLEATAAGDQVINWDGRDGEGVRVGAGLYLIRVREGAAELTAKAVRIE